MKKRITVTLSIACLTLCAAVRPQTKVTEETIPTPLQATAVSTLEPTIEDAASEAEITPPMEKEKIEITQPQAKPLYEPIPEPEPAQEEVLTILETQPMPEPESVSAPSQMATDPQPGDMVYVPGFGWLESQGPGEVVHDENIYENGNKIGIMG